MTMRRIQALRAYAQSTLYLTLLLAPSALPTRAEASDLEVGLPPDGGDHQARREPPIHVYAGPRLRLATRESGSSSGPGLGFQLGATQFWKYVGIGPELRFLWLEALESQPSMRSLEVLLKPALSLAVERMPLRVYAAAPFGLSVTWAPRGAGAAPTSRAGVVGPVLGVTALVWRRLGVNAEPATSGPHLAASRSCVASSRWRSASCMARERLTAAHRRVRLRAHHSSASGPDMSQSTSER